ncbi:hypothetical protein E2C01_085741 [Portunus trituberculatus]|uniref:Uncharacterized protein n=1 Tax=Portunus trituberculatus TaxID=210409 RepID=A0A5B7J8D6_PORTR|nr:hypothetical protein [Portunus trituberculatus]
MAVLSWWQQVTEGWGGAGLGGAGRGWGSFCQAYDEIPGARRTIKRKSIARFYLFIFMAQEAFQRPSKRKCGSSVPCWVGEGRGTGEEFPLRWGWEGTADWEGKLCWDGSGKGRGSKQGYDFPSSPFPVYVNSEVSFWLFSREEEEEEEEDGEGEERGGEEDA